MNNSRNINRAPEEYGNFASRIWQNEVDKNFLDINDNFNFTAFLCKNITLQVTEDCNLACSYCYQHNKTHNSMDFATAKQIIDTVLNDDDILNKKAIILEFIGGEPLLKIDLISQITDYYFKEMSQKDVKLAARTKISLCSNGVLYFNEKVQEYLRKYKNFISFTVSIDGNKELHDSCRVFKNGDPTYDIAVKAALHYMHTYNNHIPTKMTFAKENINYIYDGITNLYNLGYKVINCNCAYEPNWTVDDAKIIYSEFKKVADYIIDQDKETEIFNSYFSEHIGIPNTLDSTTWNSNWCGGNGNMLAADYNGIWYPCLRYMPSSIGDKQPIIECGDIKNGIDHSVLKEMQKVTYLSQSTEECINCPVNSGCGWCTAYNYEVTGDINKRLTNICWTHKARSLVNTYFYNKIYKKHGEKTRIPIYLSEEDALQIISQEEYELLKQLAKSDEIKNDCVIC